MFSQSPAPASRNNPAYFGPPSTAHARRKLYDESLAASAATSIPTGRAYGNVLVKDPKSLADATTSEKLGGYVFLGKETLDSDDPKGVLPKITPRRSLKEMKRVVLKNQGDVPFDARIRPALKKLKMSSKAQKTQPSTFSGGAHVTSPSSDEETSTSEEETENGSEYDEESTVEISPLPAIRPKDPVKAMEYDVTKIMWFKRKAHLSGSTIRNTLGSYWNLIKPVRDAWKVHYSAITDAETKDDKTKAEHHRVLANGHRQILESAIQATAQHGHSDIVTKLTENANLFLSFYQLLVDRFKESDFNGSTVTNILNLMVRCTSMNQSLMEKTKLDKVLPKLVKRGNEATQKLVQSVNSIVRSNGETENTRVPAKAVKPEPKSAQLPIIGSEATNGVKRPRESDTVPMKRVASTGQSKVMSTLNSKNVPLTKPGLASIKREAAKTETKTAAASTVPPLPTPKTKTVVPKPTSLLTGLQSASKKPGTSMTGQKSSSIGEAKSNKVVEAKKQAPTAAVPKASFSFADTLANLDKPKEIEAVEKVAEDRPPETEEEKKKRLRKEARRHLRVKWRPDANLVETRLFRHDPEEETGHDSSMIRDVTDVKNEGQMLKLHKDLELDEEEEAGDDTELAPWHPLMLVDFSDLPELARSQNCPRYGGKQEVASPQRTVQQQRELTTLIAVYPTTLDIPYSPREPAEPYSGFGQTEMPFGAGVDEKWQRLKRREEAFFSSRVPNRFQPSFQPPTPAPATDINAILKALGGQNQQPAPQQASQPFLSMLPQQIQPQAPQSSALESIFAQFTTPQTQAPVPQAPQINPSYQSVIDIFKQQQQKHQQPQYQQAPMYQPPPPATQQTPDLSALLAQFSAQNSTAQQSSYSYQASYGNENDRKRPYDDGGNQNSDGPGDSKRSKGKKAGVDILTLD
ncbi:MAG: hypothetical protein LQ340_001778 [Diploschistes diacapsis]|nr:MAG: hypothetical protein LQ340_001778 [Diploschistes diacapsis]